MSDGEVKDSGLGVVALNARNVSARWKTTGAWTTQADQGTPSPWRNAERRVSGRQTEHHWAAAATSQAEKEAQEQPWKRSRPEKRKSLQWFQSDDRDSPFFAGAIEDKHLGITP